MVRPLKVVFIAFASLALSVGAADLSKWNPGAGVGSAHAGQFKMPLGNILAPNVRKLINDAVKGKPIKPTRPKKTTAKPGKPGKATPGKSVMGKDGKDGKDGKQGKKDGRDGRDGKTGKDGKDGKAATGRAGATANGRNGGVNKTGSPLR